MTCVVNVIKQINAWSSQLERELYYDKLTVILKEIYYKFECIILPGDFEFKRATYLACEIIGRLINESADLNFLKLASKVYLKFALCHDVDAMTTILDRNFNELGAGCLQTYAFLQNHHVFELLDVPLKIVDFSIHALLVRSSIRYSDESDYFGLAVENYQKAYEIGLIKKNESFLYTVIITNLENHYQFTHKPLLKLFEQMMAIYSEKSHPDVIEDVLCELPWTNRNKYYLLGIILTVNENLVFDHRSYSADFVLNGLRTGLQYRRLLSPSQALVRVICNHPKFQAKFIKIVADILRNRNDTEVQNLIKYWYGQFSQEFIGLLFSELELNKPLPVYNPTSKEFKRLIVFRKLFKGLFQNAKVIKQIETQSCLVQDEDAKIDTLHILMDKVVKNMDMEHIEEDIMCLLKFMECNMGFESTLYRDHHVMKKTMPEFLNFLASQKMRDAKLLTVVFKFIKEKLIQHGIKETTYQHNIFGLKLLETVLKLYLGEHQPKLTKKTNQQNNLIFSEFLKSENIWNICDAPLFYQLVEMIQNENNDVVELSVKLLSEFYLQRGIMEEVLVNNNLNFLDLIEEKINVYMNNVDLQKADTAHLYYRLKFEYLLTISNLNERELIVLVEALKCRFMLLKSSNDPVAAMNNGKHLFTVINSIEYYLKKMQPEQIKSKTCLSLNVILKLIVHHFLDYVNDITLGPNYNWLDQRLITLVTNSQADIDDLDFTKTRLLHYIWYTLKACSDIMVQFGVIMNKVSTATEREYVSVMTNAIDVNVQILTRFCHKGTIEIAGGALGKITKLVSTQYQNIKSKTCPEARNLRGMLNVLKDLIDCRKPLPITNSEDLRCVRGLIVMKHQIITNDQSCTQEFLNYVMIQMIFIPKLQSFEEIKMVKFHDFVKPFHIHLLAAMVTDSELVQRMILFYDRILLCCYMGFKNSQDFVMINALLQLIGALVPKIGNQRQHVTGSLSEMMDYEPKSITIYEIYVKLTYSYRVALFDLKFQGKLLPRIYVIVLLEYLSNFEMKILYDHWHEISSMSEILEEYMASDCSTIRLLAAKCFSQWHVVTDRMPQIIIRKVIQIFTPDENFSLACIFCVRFMLNRYENCMLNVRPCDMQAVLESIRNVVNIEFCKTDLPVAPSGYYKGHLIDMLRFIGFVGDEKIIAFLASNEVNKYKNSFGHKSYMSKLKQMPFGNF